MVRNYVAQQDRVDAVQIAKVEQGHLDAVCKPDGVGFSFCGRNDTVIQDADPRVIIVAVGAA